MEKAKLIIIFSVLFLVFSLVPVGLKIGSMQVASAADNEEAEPSETKEPEESVEPAAVTPAAATKTFSWDTGASVTYDNNAFQYSSDNISEYQGYTNTNRYKGVDNISDVITNLYAFLRMDKDFFDFGATTLSLGVDGNIYAYNNEKTYEKYSASIRQKFGGDRHLLRMNYQYIPSYFVRTLYDSDTAGTDKYRKAEFDSNNMQLKYWNQLTDNLSWWLKYTLESKKYGSYFKERDTVSNIVSLNLGYKPYTWIKITPSAQYGWHNAKGKDGTPTVKPDISRAGYEYGMLVDFYPKESKFSYALGYNYAGTHYTTKHSVAADPYHAGRHQRDYDIISKIDYALKEGLNLFAQYQYSAKDVKTAGTDPTLEPASILGAIGQTVEVGAKLVF